MTWQQPPSKSSLPHFPWATTNLRYYKNGKHLYGCSTQPLFHFVSGDIFNILRGYFHTLVADVFHLSGKFYISGFILWRTWKDRRSSGTKTRRNINIKSLRRRRPRGAVKSSRGGKCNGWNTQAHSEPGPWRDPESVPRASSPAPPSKNHRSRSHSWMLGHLEAITRLTTAVRERHKNAARRRDGGAPRKQPEDGRPRFSHRVRVTIHPRGHMVGCTPHDSTVCVHTLRGCEHFTPMCP